MKLRNILYVSIALIFMVLIAQAVFVKNDKKEMQTDPVIAVSTFSLYDIVKHVSAGTVEIINILPFGVDAHSFEPTPKLMASIEKSSLVIYNGAGLEPWTDSFDFNNVINMSEHVKLRELESDEFHHHDHHDHHCAHSSIDPHYWLDTQNMIIATNIITQELIELYPQHEKLYIANAQKYMNELKSLDKLYKESLKICKLDSIVTNHNAFSYLSQKYNFHVEALSGLSPEAEASAKDIMRLMKHIKEDGVDTIFFESFISDKSMKSIAEDMNIKLDVLQPLGNITADEADNNVTYTSVMKQNLSKLSKALMCN